MTRILYGFFCEDVRSEVGGRVSAIGLWGTGMTLRSLPARVRSLGFHVCIANPSREAFPFRVSISGPGLANPLESLGQLSSDPILNTSFISWVIEGLVVSAAGTFVVDVQVDCRPPLAQRFSLEVLPPPEPPA